MMQFTVMLCSGIFQFEVTVDSHQLHVDKEREMHTTVMSRYADKLANTIAYCFKIGTILMEKPAINTPLPSVHTYVDVTHVSAFRHTAVLILFSQVI